MLHEKMTRRLWCHCSMIVYERGNPFKSLFSSTPGDQVSYVALTLI